MVGFTKVVLGLLVLFAMVATVYFRCKIYFKLKSGIPESSREVNILEDLSNFAFGVMFMASMILDVFTSIVLLSGLVMYLSSRRFFNECAVECAPKQE